MKRENVMNGQIIRNQHNHHIPILILYQRKDRKKRLVLELDDNAADVDEPDVDLAGKRLDIVIRSEKDNMERIFPVFQQKARDYGAYSEYMERHGCACCSLTTILAAYCPQWKELRPEQTITVIENSCFGPDAFRKNYGKVMARQMPVSLYGISEVMRQYGIAHRYIGRFEDKAAYGQIKEHLYRGCPVIIETSRFRRKNGHIIHWNDKKYAGSYHTMVLLGFNASGNVWFTDSATRSWAGDRQRLKEAALPELINYMFPRKNEKDTHVYFSRRRNTGGYILVDEKITEPC